LYVGLDRTRPASSRHFALDERQLPDIGLTRDLSEFNILGGHKSYRALAELDDTTLSFERTRTSGAARSQASRSRS
jgi:hypothetical protein